MGIFIEIVGWLGTLLFVLSFILVSSKRISAESKTYELMNLWGALGVGFSAYSKYDWSSFGLQIIWGIISLFFLVRILYQGRKKIDLLFICQGNMMRSQIAESLYQKYKKGRASSAGIFPIIENHAGKKLEKIMPETFFQVLKEKENLDLRKKICKEITPGMVKRAKKVIVMANRSIWPDFLKKRNDAVYWEVENPETADAQKYIQILNTIKEKILKL